MEHVLSNPMDNRASTVVLDGVLSCACAFENALIGTPMPALEPAVRAPAVKDGSEYGGMDPRINMLSEGLQPPDNCCTNTTRQSSNSIWYVVPPGNLAAHASDSIRGCNGL